MSVCARHGRICIIFQLSVIYTTRAEHCMGSLPFFCALGRVLSLRLCTGTGSLPSSEHWDGFSSFFFALERVLPLFLCTGRQTPDMVTTPPLCAERAFINQLKIPDTNASIRTTLTLGCKYDHESAAFCQDAYKIPVS